VKLLDPALENMPMTIEWNEYDYTGAKMAGLPIEIAMRIKNLNLYI